MIIDSVKQYKNLLQLFYEDYKGELDLLKLENIINSRYQLLRYVKISHDMQDDKKVFIKAQDIKMNLYPEDKESLLNDMISHQMLKLSVKNSEEESKWWIKTETLLFKSRLSFIDPVEFIKPYINFHSVVRIDFPCNEDKKIHPCYKDQIIHPMLKPKLYYKIPLSLGAHLLNYKKKNYFPIRGNFYVLESDLELIIPEIFRSGLELALDAAKNIELTDERLINIFEKMKNPDMDEYKNFTLSRNISLNNIDSLEENSFPPCMKKLYRNLKSNHHLNYNGRLQFGLYLKGLGFPLEDSLQFWKTMFAEKVTAEEFAKYYEYNIKYSYSRLGKIEDYTPWNCNKIIKMPKPALGDYHGCPFRHSNKEELISILASYPELDNEAKEWILGRYEKKPQKACVKLFQSTHPGANAEVTKKIGIYPNAYFNASYQYANS